METWIFDNILVYVLAGAYVVGLAKSLVGRLVNVKFESSEPITPRAQVIYSPRLSKPAPCEDKLSVSF